MCTTFTMRVWHLRVGACVDDELTALLELLAADFAVEFLHSDRTQVCDERLL